MDILIFVGFSILSIYSHYSSLHFSNLACTGDENRIWDCPYTNIHSQYCGPYDAAVLCQSK